MRPGNQRVAIVGGGISGLAAAHRLAALDASVEITIFEATSGLGGVLQTEQADGFCLELGPDSMLSRLPWGVDLCRQIGLDGELVSTNASPSGVHVVCRGRLERVPDGLAMMAPRRLWPLMATPILSWHGKLRLAVEAMIPRRRLEADESLADFSRRRLGREAFERLVQPLASGIYMGDPERLSIQAAFPQFVEMERKHGSLTRAARRQRARGSTGVEPGGPQYSLFVAPRRGMGQLVEALTARLRGCHIRCHQRMESLRPAEHGGWIGEVCDETTGKSREEQFSGVILALRAYSAGSLLSAVNCELGELLAGIPYCGCVVVSLAYRRDAIRHPLDSFGFVAPHIEHRPVLACTFSSIKYPGRAPEGMVLFRAFLGGACFPEVLEWPDERVQQTVADELRQLLAVSGSPLFARVMRWPRSMPQYQVGHLERVKRIEELVDGLPFVELAGNGYHGVGIPHCIRSGEQASDRLHAALENRG